MLFLPVFTDIWKDRSIVYSSLQKLQRKKDKLHSKLQCVSDILLNFYSFEGVFLIQFEENILPLRSNEN